MGRDFLIVRRGVEGFGLEVGTLFLLFIVGVEFSGVSGGSRRWVGDESGVRG